MAKTVTLRFEEEVYEEFREAAAAEGRTLSNFIETRCSGADQGNASSSTMKK